MKNKNKKKMEQVLKHQRRLLWVILLFVNGYLLLSFLFGGMGLFKSIKLKKTYHTVHQDIASLQKESIQLTARIDALRSDSFYIEQIARDRLGLVREGELIYEFYPENSY